MAARFRGAGDLRGIPAGDKPYHLYKASAALRQVQRTDRNHPRRKDRSMTEKMTSGHLQSEEDLLLKQVSDEALEAAARFTSKGANFTLGACTGLSVCPA